MKKYLLGLAVLLMGTAVMTSCSDDNYSKGSVMNIIVKRIFYKIKADFEFDRLIELNQKKAWK